MTVSYKDQIRPVTSYPSATRVYPNGEIPYHVMTLLPKFNGGPDIWLAPPAARCFKALDGMCWDSHQVRLQATSVNDSFRPRAVQQVVHDQRYQRKKIPGVRAQRCADGLWYLIPPNATAACPGESKHGDAIAVDVANAFGIRLTAMETHAAACGFAWELVDEAWHIRKTGGDTIPPAVLNWEKQHMADSEVKLDTSGRPEPADYIDSAKRGDGVMLRDLHGWLWKGQSPYSPDGDPPWIVRVLTNIGNGVTTLLARPPVQPAPIDAASLIVALQDPAVQKAMADIYLTVLRGHPLAPLPEVEQ